MKICTVRELLEIKEETEILSEIQQLMEKNFSHPPKWTKEAIHHALFEQYSVFLFAVQQGKIIAFCLIPFVLDEGELAYIVVEKAFQAKGIGQLLLDEALRQLKKNKVTTCYLELRKSNVIAYQFYQKNEWVRIGIRENYYSNPKEDAILMKRNL